MQEFPQINKKWQKGTKKAVIVYPNAYYGGIYALGPLIIYNLINQQEGWICERRFIDNATDLHQFDLIGFTWQYELDIYKIKDIIKTNSIKAPIFAGGPCIATNSNQTWADVCLLGDVEDILPQLLQNYNNKEQLAKLQGIFLPGISKEKTYAQANEYYKQYPLYQPLPQPLPKQAPFGQVFMLEIERSCPFTCNYCSIPTQYNKIRYIPLEEIKKIIDKGLEINQRKKVAIYCPAFTHPKRKEILRYILDKGATFSIPSIRVEYADQELIDLIAQGKQKTITVAPECGQTLRPTVGKNIKDETFHNFAQMCNKKVQTIKLYFMVGLPGQNEQDLKEIVQLVETMQNIFTGNIYVSINPYVPKPGTKFENHIFDKTKIKQQLKCLQKNLKVRTKQANVNTSFKEWQIAQGQTI